MKRNQRLFCFLSVFSLFLCGIVTLSHANEEVSRIDLLSSKTAHGGGADLILGLHISMLPGWKTYWRSPGDAGLPPQFNWSGSSNIGEVTVLWPKPEVFETAGLKTWGYKEDVVFPLHITILEKNKAASLHLEMFYGVCEDVCIPLKQQAFLNLPAGEGEKTANAALIETYLRQVPVSAERDGLIQDISLRLVAKKDLIAEFHSEKELVAPSVILEGEEGDFFDIAGFDTSVSKKGIKNTFEIKADLADTSRSLKGRTLTVTILDKGVAVEGQIAVK
ncbi:MAG: hypothetical protein MI743_17750 [Sneathiellales bacterium]|nr:hypothetical protein [Sneathiellales bacterium]